MVFKHPNLLWFLLLLIIPILVHLLQLRRWKKEYFTNVQLLKQLQMQSQKSSKLKKRLLLISRLLFLACLVLTFAQPFFPSKNKSQAQNQLAIVLDNSYSMGVQSQRGILFKKAIEDIIDGLETTTQFDLYTINEQFEDKDISLIKSDLLKLEYYPQVFNLEKIINKINYKNPNVSKDIIVVTDGLSELPNLQMLSQNNNHNIKYYIPKIEKKYNIAIDTVFLNNTSEQFHDISIQLSKYGNYDSEVTISLIDKGQLVAKSTKQIGNKQIVNFNLAKKSFHGYVEIEDNALEYDNRYYFTISDAPKPKILVIGLAEKNKFIKKIYTADEFELSEISQVNKSINWSDFDVVVFNEIEAWSDEVNFGLQTYIDNGGQVVIIPNANTPIKTLQSLTQNYGISWKPFDQNKQLIQKVFFAHPLFKGVFEKEVSNFAYPKVEGSFQMNTNLPTVMAYADGNPFLVSHSNNQGSLYVFSAPLHEPWSDFKQTPLIVPTFYNMAIINQNSGMQTAWLFQQKPLFLNIVSNNNQPLSLENDGIKTIPIQLNMNKKVKLSLDEAPLKAGNYQVLSNNEVIDFLSLNIPRTESDVTKQLWKGNKDFTEIQSIGNYITELKVASNDVSLWKWFLYLALLFLIAETLIQKLIK